MQHPTLDSVTLSEILRSMSNKSLSTHAIHDIYTFNTRMFRSITTDHSATLGDASAVADVGVTAVDMSVSGDAHEATGADLDGTCTDEEHKSAVEIHKSELQKLFDIGNVVVG